MRLLYIAPASSIHTKKWINHFRDEGNDVCLVSFYPSDDYFGIDYHYLPCKNKNLAFMQIGKVKSIISQFNPDLIHAHFATSCGLVAALTGFHPFVLSVWGSDLTRFPIRSFAHKLLIKSVLNKADYITATSEYLVEKVKLYSDKHPSKIPFGIDARFLQVSTTKENTEFTIGIVKSIEKLYGFDTLIEAFHLLLQDNQNIRLNIVGDGSYKAGLIAKCENMRLNDRIKFYNHVDNSNIQEIYKKIDLFVLPSYSEAFGVAAVEAAATGLPVVASNIGGLPEVVEDGKTGILVEPGDVISLVKAIKYYIDNPDKRAQHGEAGRRKVENEYNWADNAGVMNDLYHRVISEFKRP